MGTGVYDRIYIKNNNSNCLLNIDTVIVISNAHCNTFPEIYAQCYDGIDNNGNGLVDCQEYTCSAEIGHFSNVQPPSCTNGSDGSIRFLAHPELKISIDGGNTYLEHKGITNSGLIYEITNLPAGTYIFKTFNEETGCTATESITFYCQDNPVGCVHPDFQALKDLYAAMDGGNWVNANWDTTRVTCDPCAANWHGITCSDFVNLSLIHI